MPKSLSEQITKRAVRILLHSSGTCPACGAWVENVNHHAEDCSLLREDFALAQLDAEDTQRRRRRQGQA